MRTIMKIVRRWHLVILTYEIPLSREASDRVAYFESYQICEIGLAYDVINSPKEERT